jgi:putative ABC transport system ATP-binding protein
MTVIDLHQVTKTYQMGNMEYKALKGIDVSINEKELVALTGPSGSGKSTTMHILGLLDRPTTGDYFLKGQPTAHLTIAQKSTLRNQSIGFIFQSFFLLPKLTALDNVGLPLSYRGATKAEIKKRCLEELDKVGMAEYATHRPGELSGGQQQRVAIARALVGEPDIILADEPTGALDSQTSQTVMDLLVENAKRATVVVITHDPEVAKQCDRIINLRDGYVV